MGGIALLELADLPFKAGGILGGSREMHPEDPQSSDRYVPTGCRGKFRDSDVEHSGNLTRTGTSASLFNPTHPSQGGALRNLPRYLEREAVLGIQRECLFEKCLCDDRYSPTGMQ